MPNQSYTFKRKSSLGAYEDFVKSVITKLVIVWQSQDKSLEEMVELCKNIFFFYPRRDGFWMSLIKTVRAD